MEKLLRVYKQLTARVESQIPAANPGETDTTTTSISSSESPFDARYCVDVTLFAETDATETPSYSAVENDEHWVPTHGYEFDDVIFVSANKGSLVWVC